MSSQQSPDRQVTTNRRAILTAGIGNCVEWLDFGTYAFLAAVIGKLFFPSTDPTASLMASFATFAAAFLIRPIGALFFGSIGDRIGRKRTLATTIILMALSTFAIGLLPTYTSVGVLAPVLLLLARLVQGFAAGGEYGGASILIVEYAPAKRRGFLASWLEFATLTGRLISLALVLALTVGLSPDALAGWGWRLPFLVIGPLGVIGLYLRLKLDDTPEFRQLMAAGKVSKSPLRDTARTAWRSIIICGLLAIAQNVGAYLLLSYTPGYFQETLHITETTSLLVILAATAFMMALIPFVGAVSDRLGRKPILITGCIGYIVLAYPCFLLMGTGNWGLTLAGLLVLACMHALLTGALPSTTPALFHTSVRYSGFSIGYNVATSLFGGPAPLIAAFLVASTGINAAPAYYLILTSAISLIAALMIKEPAGRPLPKDADTAVLITDRNSAPQPEHSA